MRRKTALLRLGLAGLVGLLALGGKCRLGLQDTGTGPDTRPIRYRTMEIFYEPPPEWPCVGSYQGRPWVALGVMLYDPHRGYTDEITLCDPNENGICPNRRPGLPLERVGPNRWRGVVENVYVYRDPADPKHRLRACFAADIPGRNVDDPLAAYLQVVSIPGAVNTEVVRLGYPPAPYLAFHLSE